MRCNYLNFTKYRFNNCHIHNTAIHNCVFNKSTAHVCWTLDFFISDIKLQAIYKVIHPSNYDGHISKYVCKIGKYNQKCVSLKGH